MYTNEDGNNNTTANYQIQFLPERYNEALLEKSELSIENNEKL